MAFSCFAGCQDNFSAQPCSRTGLLKCYEREARCPFESHDSKTLSHIVNIQSNWWRLVDCEQRRIEFSQRRPLASCKQREGTESWGAVFLKIREYILGPECRGFAVFLNVKKSYKYLRTRGRRTARIGVSAVHRSTTCLHDLDCPRPK